jgi:hypothetical protein
VLSHPALVVGITTPPTSSSTFPKPKSAPLMRWHSLCWCPGSIPGVDPTSTMSSTSLTMLSWRCGTGIHVAKVLTLTLRWHCPVDRCEVAVVHVAKVLWPTSCWHCPVAHCCCPQCCRPHCLCCHSCRDGAIAHVVMASSGCPSLP